MSVVSVARTDFLIK